MSKFIVIWENGNQCVNCGEAIFERCIQLTQNRYAQPRCCKECLKELLHQIETGEEPDEEGKKHIVQVNQGLLANSQYF